MPNNNHLSENSIYEYLDGGLKPKDKEEFLSHISTCDVCRIALEDSRKLFNIIETVPEISDVPPLGNRVAQAILARKSMVSQERRLLTLPLAFSLVAIFVAVFSLPLEIINGYALGIYQQGFTSAQITIEEILLRFQSIPQLVASVDLKIDIPIFDSLSFTIGQTAVILVCVSLLWLISTTRLLSENASPSGTNGG